MPDPFDNLRGFQYCVEAATRSSEAERIVREMIRGAADAAPVDVVVRIGELLIQIRREDFRKEGEAN